MVASNKASDASAVGREVDFYHNPTELFRWINYRRWDGAVNRAQTCPEEVHTWIVSKDNAGNVVWRHLPLHLVSMQSTIPYSLMEVLLRIYPDASECKDHDGMTPLHLACLRGGITEKVAFLLLMNNPTGVSATDNQNRTPLDILQHASIGNDTNYAAKKAAMHVLSNMEKQINRMKQSVREEETARVEAVAKSASTERVAAQQQIMQMEKKLAEARSEAKKLGSEVKSRGELEQDFEQKIVSLQRKLDESYAEKERLSEGMKKLQEEILHNESNLDRHEEIVSSVRNAAQEEITHLREQIQSLQSETATSRAMAEALEAQLKNKFTEDQHISSHVKELETSLKETALSRSRQEKKIRDKAASLHEENAELKETIQDLTKDNLILQSKVKELSDTVSKLLASQNILSAEQDRLIESTEKNEQDLIESMQAERSKLLKMLEKQRKFLLDTYADQTRVIEQASKMEQKIQASVSSERERTLRAIYGIKKEFKDAEIAERQRKKMNLLRRNGTGAPSSTFMESRDNVGSSRTGTEQPHLRTAVGQLPQNTAHVQVEDDSNATRSRFSRESTHTSTRIPSRQHRSSDSTTTDRDDRPTHRGERSRTTKSSLRDHGQTRHKASSSSSMHNNGRAGGSGAKSSQEMQTRSRGLQTSLSDTSKSSLYSSSSSSSSVAFPHKQSNMSKRQYYDAASTGKTTNVDSGRFMKLEDVGQLLLSGGQTSYHKGSSSTRMVQQRRDHARGKTVKIDVSEF